MSPAALALAIGLHVLVAAALWWAQPSRRLDHAETPIMVSVEPEPLSAGNLAAAAPPTAEPVQSEATPSPPDPAPPTTTAESTRQAAVAPATPAPPEPAPPDPIPAEMPAAPPSPPPPRSAEPAPAAPPPQAAPNDPAAEPAPAHLSEPSPPETAAAAPEPLVEGESEGAWQTDVSSWKPQVTVEPSLAAPPPRPARPAPRYPTAPRTAQAPGQRLQDYPPQTSSLGGPSSSSFDQSMGDGGARNDYLSRVYRHVEPYRDYPAAARAARQHGRVVTRVTISRSGELLDIRLDRSSGWPLIDNAEIAAIRRAMPLPPVPDGMRGDPVVLVLPMNY